jgi:RHS repeat-associated protein
MRLASKQFILMIILVISVSAQVATGTPPFGSFGGGPFDIINLGNLNVHLAIPVLHRSGRGTPFTYDLSYDSSVWSPVTSSGTTQWQPASGWGWKGTTEAALGYISQTSTSNPCTYYINGRAHTYNYTSWRTYGYGDKFGAFHAVPMIYTDNDTQQYCGIDQLSGSATTTDGSGYTITVTRGLAAKVTSVTGFTISAPVTKSGSGAGTFTDPNGNQITLNTSGQFFDTLSSTTPVLTVAGSGTPASPFTFTYTNPSSVSPYTSAYTMKYTQYTVQTAFGFSAGSPIISEYGPVSVPLVSSILLPDGSSYMFTYEPGPGTCALQGGTTSCVTGRIKEITLPTGGSITYSYTGGTNGTGIYSDGSSAGFTRQLSPGGTWAYSRSPTGPTWNTLITDPTSSQNQTSINFAEGGGSNFYETQRQVYQGAASGTPLLTLLTCYNGNFTTCATAAVSSVARTDVFRTVPTATSSKTSLSEIVYNGYGLPQSDAEYDYGMTAGVAPPTGWNALLLSYTTYLYAALGNNIVGRPSQITLKNGATGAIKAQATYTYDQGTVTSSGAPQHVSISGARGNLTTLALLTSGTSTLTSTNTYYDNGNLNTSTDVNGGVTTYKYLTDSCGVAFPTEIDLPISVLKLYQDWNCTGAVLNWAEDPNLNKTAYTYGDPNFWRPTTISYPDGGSTIYTYNEGTNSPWSIQTSSSKDSSSSVVSDAILDGFGRVTQQELTSDPVQNDVVVTAYDPVGRVASVTNPYRTTSDPTYGVTQYAYDPLNRPTSITHPGGTAIGYQYLGAAMQTTDEGYNSGGTSQITHIYQTDGLGRTTSVCELSSATLQGSAGTPAACGLDIAGTGFLTTYQYDPIGNLSQVQQAGVGTRTYSYDGFSRLTQEINPESGTTTYTYDLAGQQGDLYQRTRPKQNQTGVATVVTTYSFDKLHRPTGKSYNDGSTPTITLTYDQATVGTYSPSNPKGQLTDAVVAANVAGTIYGYDTMGRVAQEWQCTPLNCGTSTYWLGYQYDRLGDVTQFVNGTEGTAGVTYTYSYDTAAHLIKLTSSLSDSYHPATLLTINSTNYNALGEFTQATLGNGILRSIAYDNRGRATSLTDGSIYSFSLGYANDSNILTGNDSVNGNWTYTYDAMNRISTSSKAGNAYNYKYDPAGNRWQQNVTTGTGPAPQYTLNSNNQITTSGVLYDAPGNVTNDGLGNTYTYDAEGRLTAVSGSNSASYVYDALGQRVRTVVNSQTSDFIFDPTGRALDQLSGATWQRGEIFIGGLHLATYNNVVVPATTYFDHADWVGTVRARSNATGTSAETCTSLPFGDSQNCTNTDVSTLHFAGLTGDSESNLQHAWYRQYSTTQGRWTVSDPTGLAAVNSADPQTWNRYVYVADRLLRYADPLGLNIKDCVWYAGTAGCTPCPNCGAPPPPGGDGGGSDGSGGGADTTDCSVFSPNCPSTPTGLFGGNNIYDMSVISMSGPLWAIDAAAEKGWSSNLAFQILLDQANMILNNLGVGTVSFNPLDVAVPWWEALLVGPPLGFKNPAVPSPTPLQPPGTKPTKCPSFLKKIGQCPTNT